MVRQRQPAQGPAQSSRKRTRDDDESEDEAATASSSKRSNREPKHVNFPRRLESGPTKSHADHRHQCPTKGVMRIVGLTTVEVDTDDEEEGEHVEVTDEDDIDGASLSANSDCTDAPNSERDPSTEWVNGDDLGASVFSPPKTIVKPKKPARPPMPSVSAPRATTSRPSSSVATAALPSASNGLDDARVCNNMHELRNAVKGFADAFPVPRPRASASGREGFGQLLRSSNEHTVRYVGCLALGGKNGEDSWRELLRDVECRKALVFGIIGRALKESVFSELWFGATEEQHKELSTHEQNSVDLDGFIRTSQRAERCEEFASHGNEQTSVISLLKAEAKVVVQLEKLLGPLAATVGGNGRTPMPLDVRSLNTIVSMAADLSRSMRLMSNVVYYWPPTFKDEEFEPARMESNNLRYMIEESPYEKKDMHGRVRAVLLPDHADRSEAIVRVVCFPGLVAYRQGGGELGKRLLHAEGLRQRNALEPPPDVQEVNARSARHDGITEDSGFRTKVICKAVVHLQWGKQRLLTKEAGTSAHLDAVRDHSNKYEEDRRGFKELFDIYLDRNTCLNCSNFGHIAAECTNISRQAGLADYMLPREPRMEKLGKAGGPAAGGSSRPLSRKGSHS
ncbi:hypothetical protein LTR36_006170 [Oleoguttula mirabilis]|uniref:CCHC-type domain-containing protein n=1 Tax=Oleoguttula mirabilis TaxID=1507867 RepID=A0AAV9JCW2_9PEZI|nr:hypothetical protein LTR36_006170 [Oleoguttula mirabilis]